MQIQRDDVPHHPLPDLPRPQTPQQRAVQQPMVFVYEKQQWEYKVVVADAVHGQSLAEDDLNALGASGWELVGVVPLAGKVQFYFKRVRT
jgi:hypothetical protein